MAANDDGVDVVVAEETTHDLQSLLSSSERDYLVRNNGDQVKIDTLKGKKLGIYFSASWCGPCRRFTPNLVEVYNELLPKGDFEIVFASADKDDDSFDKYFSKMPWLAVPFSDSDTRGLLDGTFSVMGIPHLVMLDGNGKVLTDGGVEIIGEYGADAYPFTEERIKEIEAPYEEMAKGWPEKVKHALHEHELAITRRKGYTCDGCDEVGSVWAFSCEECDFDLHPKCALEEDKGTKEGAEEAAKKEQEPKEG